MNTAILELAGRLREMTVANGCTFAEAENAAARLAGLLREHQLSIADLKTGSLGEDMTRRDLLAEGLTRWSAAQKSYATEVCRAFNCDVVYSGAAIVVLGAESDVEVATYFFETTWPSVREEGRRAGKAEGRTGRSLVVFYENFLRGCGRAVHERLKRTEETRQVLEGSEPTAALVPLKQAKVKEYVGVEFPSVRVVQGSSRGRSWDGFANGREYGATLPLSRPLRGGAKLRELS